MTATLRALDSAIARALASAAGIVRVQDAAALTEGIPDLPLIQVLWTGSQTSPGAASDRLTFGAGVRSTDITFTIDVYARPRSHLGEDAARAIDTADAVQAVLESERHPPFFGVTGANAIRWRAERVTFEYGATAYAGVRFTLTVTVFS
ncbi:MAG: hypothetical protein SGJ24_18960 [Chloroflexota bacterium]|nr:hypothetical protein [Chloroflexota bacterium]